MSLRAEQNFTYRESWHEPIGRTCRNIDGASLRATYGALGCAPASRVSIRFALYCQPANTDTHAVWSYESKCTVAYAIEPLRVNWRNTNPYMLSYDRDIGEERNWQPWDSINLVL